MVEIRAKKQQQHDCLGFFVFKDANKMINIEMVPSLSLSSSTKWSKKNMRLRPR